MTEPEPGLCMMAFDVTPHRAREAALRESEEKLRVALAAAGMGLWSWDLTTDEVQWDERMKELCGGVGPLYLNEYVAQLVHPDDRELVIEAGRATQSTGVFVGCPHRIVRPDGTVRWMLTSATMLRDERGKPVRLVGGNLDITEQRRLEEQLRHAQRMEALGTLTAGITHNLNNMLMVLVPSLALLERVAPCEHRQVARDARESAERGAEHIRQLMTFAGQREAPRPRVAQHVGDIVEKALRMCRRSFDRHIELEAAVAPAMPAIHGDAGGLEHVLLNILLNARDALTSAASPRIRVVVDTVDEVVGAPMMRHAPRYARIRVEDNGAGMTPEIQSKIFEPFFSTKGADRGSGLGLATSYTIVREHEGWIECSSRPGEGTVMTIHLPATEEETAPPPGQSPTVPSPGCRILLVDDEASIRSVVARLLDDEGHQVVAIGEVGEALAAAEQHTDVALVMLDRSMRGAQGHMLVGSLRDRLPDARIVYFTGHDVPDHERALVDGVLRKPMSGEALMVAVRTLVGPPP